MWFTQRVSPQDDLHHLASMINAAEWDEDNEMPVYDAEALAAYLADDRRVLVAVYTNEQKQALAGLASSNILLKPYKRETWLYVDEVDTSSAFRQQGVGKAIMTYLLAFAEEQGCDDVWLGTEMDNPPAIALYRSMKGKEEAVYGYTWSLDDE